MIVLTVRVTTSICIHQLYICTRIYVCRYIHYRLINLKCCVCVCVYFIILSIYVSRCILVKIICINNIYIHTYMISDNVVLVVCARWSVCMTYRNRCMSEVRYENVKTSSKLLLGFREAFWLIIFNIYIYVYIYCRTQVNPLSIYYIVSVSGSHVRFCDIYIDQG